MKIKLLAIGIALLNSLNIAKSQTLEPVNLAEVIRDGQVFTIEAGEATIGGELIKRVEIGKNSAIITYFNKTDKTLQPKYSFRVYDAYGIELCLFNDMWMLDNVKPGEARTESKEFYITDLTRMLKFSKISLPSDWASPLYLVIQGQAEKF